MPMNPFKVGWSWQFLGNLYINMYLKVPPPPPVLVFSPKKFHVKIFGTLSWLATPAIQEVIHEEKSRQRPIVIDFFPLSPQYALVLGSLDALFVSVVYKQPKGLGGLMMTKWAGHCVSLVFFSKGWLLRLFFLHED